MVTISCDIKRIHFYSPIASRSQSLNIFVVCISPKTPQAWHNKYWSTCHTHHLPTIVKQWLGISDMFNHIIWNNTVKIFYHIKKCRESSFICRTPVSCGWQRSIQNWLLCKPVEFWCLCRKSPSPQSINSPKQCLSISRKIISILQSLPLHEIDWN